MIKKHRLVSRAALWFLGMLMAATVGVGPATGATVTWLPTGGTNDWFVGTNWSGGSAPTNGDDIVITNVNIGVLLTNSTDFLSSLTISNTATLIFSNWSTKLSATDVTFQGSARITLPPAFTNGAMSNRVWIACTNLFLGASARINADDKGYAAVVNTPGSGPGGGGSSLGGGGYGGRGGDRTAAGGGLPYGSLQAPDAPGSAGHSDADYDGGHGGGAIRIEAPNGAVTVNGVISANGGSTSGTAPWYGWNGSGGGIYITCRTFAGTNGIIMANAGINSAQSVGGGGRIAVVYDTTAQAGMPKPRVLFSAAKGSAAPFSIRNTPQEFGTIYFPDEQVLDETWLPHTGQVWMASASWNVNSLTVSNGWIRFPANGFRLTVTNSALIWGSSAKLELGGDQVSRLPYFGPYEFISCSTNGPTFTVGGNLTITNGGSLTVYSAPTNSAATNYGAAVTVSGNVVIASNAWIYLHSHPTNGGSVRMLMSNLTITGPSGGINADYRGYRKPFYENVYSGRIAGFGPGGGRGSYASGGYGGIGADYYNAGNWGLTYGTSNAPIDPGSAGSIFNSGDAFGGNGGGFIWIEAQNTVTIKGSLTATGQTAYAYFGGGSGGGIYIRCRLFVGDTNGSIKASGGNGGIYGGGGGGGRIAIWRMYDTAGNLLSVSVTNGLNGGTGSQATPGTVFWGQVPFPGTIFSFH